jgi:hypothetical protein
MQKKGPQGKESAERANNTGDRRERGPAGTRTARVLAGGSVVDSAVKAPVAKVPRAEVPVAKVPQAEVPVAKVPQAEVPVAEGSTSTVRARIAKARLWYVPPLLLVCIAVASAAAVVLVFPQEPATRLPASPGLTVFTDQPVSYVSVEVRPLPPDLVGVQIAVPTKQPTSVTAYFDVPKGAKVVACYAPFCDYPSGSSWAVLTGVYVKDLQEEMMAIRLSSVSYAWDTNGVTALLQLPQVSISPSDPLSKSNVVSPQTSLYVQYDVDISAYQLTGGTPPYYIGIDSVQWREPISDASGLVSVVGTDRSAQQHETFALFLSGALIGVVGGALIGAVQEVFRR